VQEVALKGLSRKACERLIQHALGNKVPAQLVARIVEQSAGNALFLEELIRAAAEGNAETLPETVVAMLQARIGRFVPESRQMLRAASVFGQTFWRGGVAMLLGLPTDASPVDHWLRTLVDAELIEEHRDSRLPEEKEYGFRHALMREAAYSLLTEQDLSGAHEHAAHYLERKVAGDPAHDAILAFHFGKAGRAERASEYSLRAGRAATRLYALGEARTHYRNALAAFARLEDTPELRRRRIDTLLLLIGSSHWAEPLERLNVLLTECYSLLESLLEGTDQAPEDLRRLARTHYSQARCQYSHGHWPSALEAAKQGRDIAVRCGDAAIAGSCIGFIGHVYSLQGRFRVGIPYHEQAYVELEQFPLLPERRRNLGSWGWTLAYHGQVQEGLAKIDRVRELALEQYDQTIWLITQCLVFNTCRRWQDLEAAAKPTVALAKNAADEIQVILWLLFLARAAAGLGQLAAAAAHLAEVRARSAQHRTRTWLNLSMYLEGETALVLGEVDKAITCAQAALEDACHSEAPLGQGLAYRLWAQALAVSSPSAVEKVDSYFEKSLRLFEEFELWLEAAHTRTDWAAWTLTQGHAKVAIDLLGPALDILNVPGLELSAAQVQRLLEEAHIRLS
jgi:tetratricopeptide (TPR) repeat protein